LLIVLNGQSYIFMCCHRPAGRVVVRSLLLSPPPPLFHRYHMHCFIVRVGWRGWE
jgi:hypothetical protein